MSDYRVDVKVKNGKLLKAMQANGIFTASDLARRAGTTPNETGWMLNLSKSPLTKQGQWKSTVLRVSELLKTLPEDLFPKQHITAPLPTNKASFDANIEDIENYFLPPVNPENKLITDQAFAAMDRAIDRLPEREKFVLIQRFGLRGETPKTLKELGDELNVGAERVRKLERRALRRLREYGKISEENIRDMLYETQQR